MTANQAKKEIRARDLFAQPEIILPLIVGVGALNLAAISDGAAGFGEFVALNLLSLAIGGVILALTVSSGEWVMGTIGALVYLGVFSGLILGTWDYSAPFAVIPALAALGYTNLIAINFARRREPAIEPEPLTHVLSGWFAVAAISLAIAFGMRWIADQNLTNWLWFGGASAALLVTGVALSIALIRGSVLRDKRRFVPGQRLLPAPRE